MLASGDFPAPVLVALVLLFLAALQGLLRQTRARRRTGGTEELDVIWEFLHEPEEAELPGGVPVVRGELPDGRLAEVVLRGGRQRRRIGGEVDEASEPTALELAVAVDRPGAADLDAATLAKVERGEAPWPEGWTPVPERETAARRALTQLVESYDLDQLAISGGRLRAQRVLMLEDRLRETPRILQLLGVVARAFETRAEVSVRVGSAHGSIRCSYCHGALAPEDVTRTCERCSTVLHEGCWDELGRCPMLGCGGKASERTRERAS